MSQWVRVLVPGMPTADPAGLSRVASRLDSVAATLESWAAAEQRVASELLAEQRATWLPAWWLHWRAGQRDAAATAAWARDLARRVRAFAALTTWAQTAIGALRGVELVSTVAGVVAVVSTLGASGPAAAAGVAAARAAIEALLREVRSKLLVIVAGMAQGVAVGALARSALSAAQDVAVYRPLAVAADPDGVASWYGWDRVARRSASRAVGAPSDLVVDLIGGGLARGLLASPGPTPGARNGLVIADLAERGQLRELTDAEASLIWGAGRVPGRNTPPQRVTEVADGPLAGIVRIAARWGITGETTASGVVIGTGPGHTTIVTNRDVLFQPPQPLAGTTIGPPRTVTELAFPLPGSNQFEFVSTLDAAGRPITTLVPLPDDLLPNDQLAWRRQHPHPDLLPSTAERRIERNRLGAGDLAVLHVPVGAPRETFTFDLPSYSEIAGSLDPGSVVQLGGFQGPSRLPRGGWLPLGLPPPGGPGAAENVLLTDVGYLYTSNLVGGAAEQAFGTITSTAWTPGAGSAAWSSGADGRPVLLGLTTRGVMSTRSGTLRVDTPLLYRQSFSEHLALPDAVSRLSRAPAVLGRSDITRLVHLNESLLDWLRRERDHPR